MAVGRERKVQGEEQSSNAWVRSSILRNLYLILPNYTLTATLKTWTF